MVTVLESVATGIIAFTDELELLSINRAALQMLQLDAAAGRHAARRDSARRSRAHRRGACRS